MADEKHGLYGVLPAPDHPHAEALLADAEAAGFDRAALLAILARYGPAVGRVVLEIIRDLLAARKQKGA